MAQMIDCLLYRANTFVHIFVAAGYSNIDVDK